MERKRVCLVLLLSPEARQAFEELLQQCRARHAVNGRHEESLREADDNTEVQDGTVR